MRLLKGATLTKEQRKEIESAFVYMHTSIGEGKIYPNIDAWINAHAFYITDEGVLSQKHKYCEPFFMADDIIKWELWDVSFKNCLFSSTYNGESLKSDDVANDLVEQYPDWDDDCHLIVIGGINPTRETKQHYRVKYWRADKDGE